MLCVCGMFIFNLHNNPRKYNCFYFHLSGEGSDRCPDPMVGRAPGTEQARSPSTGALLTGVFTAEAASWNHLGAPGPSLVRISKGGAGALETCKLPGGFTEQQG